MLKHSDPDSPSGFRYELTGDDMDAGATAVLMTGPIAGTIALDGASYDVTEDLIAVRPEHIEPLQAAILRAHRAAGRFLDAE